MKKLLLASLAALATAASLPAQSMLLGRNIFPEGSFDIFGESRLIPNGWRFPDRQDTPWAAGFRAEAVKGEGSGRELRIINPTAGYTGVIASIILPQNIDRMRISFRVFVKTIELGEPDPSGNGAGIYFRIFDKDENSLSEGWVGGGTLKSADTEWIDRETVLSVSPSAVRAEIQIIMRGASGEIRVDDVELVPVAMSE